jgi:hypothetical protein
MEPQLKRRLERRTHDLEAAKWGEKVHFLKVGLSLRCELGPTNWNMR